MAMSGSAAFLHRFKSLLPKHRAPQEEILAWLATAHAQAEMTLNAPASDEEREALIRNIKKRVIRFGCSTDRIQYRNSSLDDFTHTDWEKMRIFSLKSRPAGRSAQERSQLYAEVVNEVFQQFYSEEQNSPSVLVHVTCTGYVSPSGAQRLVASKNWGESTEVFHAYHMGCYAALPAVRLAKSFLAGGKTSVDLVHTELCTLHLDPTQHGVEQLMMQTLFADGLIRYSASPVPPTAESSLEVLTAREEIIPNTENEMTWMASDHGMRMTLSRSIPDRIAEVLDGFLCRLVTPTRISVDEMKKNAIFAVHPGGPRIIDHVKDLLGLRDDQVAASNRILRAYGNMSSATLPHIWQSILEDESVPPNTPVVSLAFGPGLTISSAVLTKRHCPT